MRAALAIPASTAASEQADQMTERKVKDIVGGYAKSGMRIAGHVMQDNDGKACIVHMGAVRWLSNDELHAVVHPAALLGRATTPSDEDVVSRETKCRFCGQPSGVDPSDQCAPADYCQPSDHFPDSIAQISLDLDHGR